MQAVILCGGQGTRLRELTHACPKPLVEIGDRPILWHVMQGYAHHGVRKFVLCLGYKGHMIKRVFPQLRPDEQRLPRCRSASRVEYAMHGPPLGPGPGGDAGLDTGASATSDLAAGIARWAASIEGHDAFLATYGDGTGRRRPPGALMAFHRSHGRLATVTAVRPESRYGVLELGDDGRAKPIRREAPARRLDQRRLLRLRPPRARLPRRRRVHPRAASPSNGSAEEGQLMAYRHDGFFCTPAESRTATTRARSNGIWDRGEAPWSSPGGEGDGRHGHPFWQG